MKIATVFGSSGKWKILPRTKRATVGFDEYPKLVGYEYIVLERNAMCKDEKSPYSLIVSADAEYIDLEVRFL